MANDTNTLPPCPLCGAPCNVDAGWSGGMEWSCWDKQKRTSCLAAYSEDAWRKLAELGAKASRADTTRQRVQKLDDEAYDSVAPWLVLAMLDGDTP